MTRSRLLLPLIAALSFSAPPVLADGTIDDAVKARQAMMKGYGRNMGNLGKMAKGETAYDAATAQAAAAALAALSASDQSAMWPAESDNFALGEAATRAKPDIWDDPDDFAAKTAALARAIDTMAASAGDGLGALQGAIGGVGRACGACHKQNRAPKP